jgi:hypothetical protein
VLCDVLELESSVRGNFVDTNTGAVRYTAGARVRHYKEPALPAAIHHSVSVPKQSKIELNKTEKIVFEKR